MARLIDIKLEYDAASHLRWVQRARQTFIGIPRKSIQAAGREVVSLLQENSPFGETNEFKFSWTYTTRDHGGGSVELLVENHARHAKFVIFGTKPHIIRVGGKAVMTFEGIGQLNFTGGSVGFHDQIFTKVIHHPGAKPNDMLDRPEFQIEVEERTRRQIESDIRRELVFGSASPSRIDLF